MYGVPPPQEDYIIVLNQYGTEDNNDGHLQVHFFSWSEVHAPVIHEENGN